MATGNQQSGLFERDERRGRRQFIWTVSVPLLRSPQPGPCCSEFPSACGARCQVVQKLENSVHFHQIDRGKQQPRIHVIRTWFALRIK